MSENNNGSIVGGFLLGAVLGAGLALLFAPMAGDRTRRHLGDAARRLKDGTRDQMDTLKSAIKDGVGDVGAAIDAGRESFRRGAEKPPTAREHA